MHVVIGGFGRVGRYLAHMLESEGHTVGVIDRNPAVFAEYGEEIRGRKLTGEVFDRDTLIKAGIEKASAFAAVTAGDNSNIVSARVARERFGVETVVARIFDPRRANLYEHFGIPTISSVRWAGRKLLTMILEPEVPTERIFGGGEVVTVQALVTAAIAGKTVGEFEEPDRFRVTVLVRDGAARLPDADTVIAETDRLYVTATRQSISELRQSLGLGEGGAE
ncbi:MAG: potassium transporter TrkA [Actinobacteria bacterium HGW-Actinobacteria-7]|nr:MAG: potassium transporter TrkA [Actinobacteria bacterium HGW-Actinobacteria-7]